MAVLGREAILQAMESGAIGVTPFDSQQVLAMSNFGPAPMAVHPGTAICQFVFQILQGSESYSGRVAGQTEHSF